MKQTRYLRCLLITLLAAVLLNAPVLFFAQQKVTVASTVIDESSKPVSGATVQLKGGDLSVATDVNGIVPDITLHEAGRG